ncbi:hypothetical protein GRJ2_002118800 [Grus japonensis]|uniref:Uncharacterized protein n=1 Tax=Grus japonensis TaxID=30415 RepID=A0ABC9XFQ6_GRUJA
MCVGKKVKLERKEKGNSASYIAEKAEIEEAWNFLWCCPVHANNTFQFNRNLQQKEQGVLGTQLLKYSGKRLKQKDCLMKPSFKVTSLAVPFLPRRNELQREQSDLSMK